MNKNDYKVNDRISANKVKFISEDGEASIISIKEALEKAEDAGLDLVAMNNEEVPVCKVMDFSKFIYNREKAQKKNKQKKSELKEIRMNPFIAENDIKVKAKTADRILSDGDKIKITLRFTGRAKLQIGTGAEKLHKFVKHISHDYTIEKDATTLAGNVSMIISPK